MPNAGIALCVRAGACTYITGVRFLKVKLQEVNASKTVGLKMQRISFSYKTENSTET
jgi:hypothetical protein